MRTGYVRQDVLGVCFDSGTASDSGIASYRARRQRVPYLWALGAHRRTFLAFLFAAAA